MNQGETSNEYQMIAFLLQYPDQQTFDALPELQEEVQLIEDNAVRKNLQQFIDRISNQSLDEWIDDYIAYFDFEKTTNLYVTYLKLGEQRERGLELLKLKNFYEAAGFDVTNKELPDYLPLMLEFCANVPTEKSNELLEMHVQAIYEIKESLIKSESWYVSIFKALLAHMEKSGILIVIEEVKKDAEVVYSYAEEREMMKNRISWNIRQPKGGEMR